MSSISRDAAVQLLIFSRADQQEKVLEKIYQGIILFDNLLSERVHAAVAHCLEAQKALLEQGVMINAREKEMGIVKATKKANEELLTEIFMSCYETFSDEEIAEMAGDLKCTNNKLDNHRDALKAFEGERMQEFIKDLAEQRDREFEEIFDDD